GRDPLQLSREQLGRGVILVEDELRRRLDPPYGMFLQPFRKLRLLNKKLAVDEDCTWFRRRQCRTTVDIEHAPASKTPQPAHLIVAPVSHLTQKYLLCWFMFRHERFARNPDAELRICRVGLSVVRLGDDEKSALNNGILRSERH